MTKNDNFSILSKMCDRNDDSIKSYPGDTNLINANMVKDGWGRVVMAVDNKTVSDIAFGSKSCIVLLVYDSDVFKQIKKEFENEKE